jgi:hypothetical protein
MDSAEKAVAKIVKARAKAAKGTEIAPKGKAANLVAPWAPGESGNPAGAAPGSVYLKPLLKARLAEIPPGTDRRSYAELLVDSTVRAACKGDSAARKLCFEYVDGPPRIGVDVVAMQAVDHTDARERLQAALDQMRDRINQEMTEAEREAEEVKLDGEIASIEKALAAADPRRAQHKLELYAAYAVEAERATGTYCTRLDCSARAGDDE